MVNKGKRRRTCEPAAGTSKKLHKQEADEEIHGVAGHLPHEILLNIFAFLTISDRCQMAR
jgi:hypothetical protein